MNKDWIKIKKGWIRIHVILSILFGIATFPIFNPHGPIAITLRILIESTLYWVGLYLIRFLINWIKEGFKES